MNPLADPAVAIKAFRAGVAALLAALGLLCLPATGMAADDGVPLIVGGRGIHVFRAPIGTFTPAERAEGARKRIERAFGKRGDG